MRKYLNLAAIVAVVVTFILGVAATSPNSVLAAIFSSASTGTVPPDRNASLDGNGLPIYLDGDRGYRVFVYNADTTPRLVKDESGNAPSCGQLHKLCLLNTQAATAGQITAAAYDTATLTAGGINDTAKIAFNNIAQVFADTAKVVCSDVLDAQFNSGLALSNSSANSGVTSWALWRPCSARK